MNKVLLIATLILGFIVISCTIESLPKEEISYKDLPQPVKESFFEYNSSEHIIELNNPKRYEYSSSQNILIPWNYTGYISEKGSFWKREINPYEKYGSPYVVYGDSLYLPNQWNIYREDSLSYTFTRFILR